MLASYIHKDLLQQIQEKKKMYTQKVPVVLYSSAMEYKNKILHSNPRIHSTVKMLASRVTLILFSFILLI